MTELAAKPEARWHPRRGQRMLVGVVFVLAVGLRCGWVLLRTDGADGPEVLTYADERDYWRMASSWMAGETMSDETGMVAARMPGYPLFLALWMHTPWPVLAARLAQAILAGGGCVVFALIGRRLGGLRLGWVAGLLTALDPFAILFTNLLLSETLFTAALGLSVWVGLSLAVRDDEVMGRGVSAPARGASLWRWAGWGVSFLLCVYLHPSVVLILPIGGVLLLVRLRWRRGLAGLAVALLVLVLGLAPWSVRNQRLLGGRCWLTSRLGISLYDGVGPGATGRSDLAYTREIAELRGLDELSRNRWFTARSLEYLGGDPGRMLGLAWRKLLLTWNVVPNVEAHRTPAEMLVSAAWMVPVLLLGAVGLFTWPARRGDKAFLLMPVVYFTLLHMVFVGSVRYRVPVMPYVEVLAAAGLLFVQGGWRANLVWRPRV